MLAYTGSVSNVSGQEIPFRITFEPASFDIPLDGTPVSVVARITPTPSPQRPLRFNRGFAVTTVTDQTVPSSFFTVSSGPAPIIVTDGTPVPLTVGLAGGDAPEPGTYLLDAFPVSGSVEDRIGRQEVMVQLGVVTVSAGDENDGQNDPPIADAGPNQTVDEGAIVGLDGSGSSDPEGEDLSYQWTAPAGVTLSSATAERPNFTAPVQLVTDRPLTFSLVVTDERGAASAPDTVVITTTAGGNDPAGSPTRDRTRRWTRGR